MKKFLLFLFLIGAVCASGQNYPGSINEKETDSLLDKVRLHQSTEEGRKALLEIAIAIQNNGQRLDEELHDYKKSLQTIDKAITLYDALNDTLNLAFNKKYKGHLLLRLGKIPQAKAEIRTAINLYRLKNTGPAIASSQFDLARIFEFENKTDSAIYYADVSRSYWKAHDDNLQILVINNMMVYHLLQLNQTERAASVYHESQLLLAKQPPHWQPVLDFYFTSMLLFKQTNDATNASHYRDLYADKLADLRKEGITARSYYEMLSQ